MGQSKEASPKRFENPLTPDEVLRRMYTAMLQMRLLEERVGGRRKKDARTTVLGEEAARASTALSLAAGDTISDCSATAGMELLLGAPVRELKRARVKGVVSEFGTRVPEGGVLRLPPAADAEEQMEIAVGAAAALKAQRAGRVLLVYAREEAVRKKVWKRTLGLAGARELPVIFVVLPEGEGGKGAAGLRSRRWGVPGFPADGSDAIALYRVMQESLLRARTDGGPALIQCVAFSLAGKRREDPVKRMQELLLAKGVADEAWIRRTREVFLRKLGSARV